jgi:hypothetical protein
MVKNLVTYLFILLGVDMMINLFINFLQGTPGGLIMTSLVVRLVSLLLLLFPTMTLSYILLKNKGMNALLIVSFLSVYVLIPLVIYLLKDNQKSIWEVYVETHSKMELFSLIYLPYILATATCIFFLNKTKLF